MSFPPTYSSQIIAQHPILCKIINETINEESINIESLQPFINEIDTIFQSNESVINLGQSIYQSNLFVIGIDIKMNIIIWNKTAIYLTGYSTQEVYNKNIIHGIPYFLSIPSIRIIENAFKVCLTGHYIQNSTSLNFIRKDGSSFNLFCSFNPFINMNQEINGMILMGQMIPIDSNLVTIKQKIENHHQDTNSSNVQIPLRKKNSRTINNKSKFIGWEEIAKDYIIESVLGQGSYGQVAKAKHKLSGEIVAIKKIQDVFMDPIDAKRILREMCIIRQLKHPNIVQIREIIRPQDMDNFTDLYVVFEYLPTDLEKLLHSPQFLTAEHIRWLLLDLLKALKYLHSAHIVHRDLKPANVLLNLSPVAIKICDFGLARGIDNISTLNNNKNNFNNTNNIEGSIHPRTSRQKIQRQLTEHVVTRWYRAPEIIFRDHDYSCPIDVWSVGCIFAELLSMQESSIPSYNCREPLFPGFSCFPLSPIANSDPLPQDSKDQLNTILDVLGTMEEDDIKDIADPDARKYLRNMKRRPKKSFKEMYKGAEDSAIDLLSLILQMNPKKRITIDDALKHPYLDSIRSLEEEILAPAPIKIEFDEMILTIPEIRKLMQEEIRYYHPDPTIDNKKIRITPI